MELQNRRRPLLHVSPLAPLASSFRAPGPVALMSQRGVLVEFFDLREVNLLVEGIHSNHQLRFYFVDPSHLLINLLLLERCELLRDLLAMDECVLILDDLFNE